MSVGERIKEARLKINLSQVQLAIKAKLTPAAISQYESNTRTPNLEATQRIAEVLGVTVDYLVGDIKLNKNEEEKKNILFRQYDSLTSDDKKHLEEFLNFLANKSEK